MFILNYIFNTESKSVISNMIITGCISTIILTNTSRFKQHSNAIMTEALLQESYSSYQKSSIRSSYTSISKR